MYLAEVEKNLTSRFGRKVRVVDKGKKGRIELEYYDTDDLNALLDVLEQVKGGSR
jgi:ParB family chromosome partitioning protein